MPTFTDDILINADTPAVGDSVTLAIETVDGKAVTPVKILFGEVNTGTEVTSSTPLPVETGGLTDAQLRAAAIDVNAGIAQPLTDAQLRAAPIPVIGGASGGVIASDSVTIYPDNLAQTLNYNGDGTLNYIQVTNGANVYRQTLTYSAGKLIGISQWVLQ